MATNECFVMMNGAGGALGLVRLRRRVAQRADDGGQLPRRHPRVARERGLVPVLRERAHLGVPVRAEAELHLEERRQRGLARRRAVRRGRDAVGVPSGELERDDGAGRVRVCARAAQLRRVPRRVEVLPRQAEQRRGALLDDHPGDAEQLQQVAAA